MAVLIKSCFSPILYPGNTRSGYIFAVFSGQHSFMYTYRAHVFFNEKFLFLIFFGKIPFYTKEYQISNVEHACFQFISKEIDGLIIKLSL